jgi:hypothetical protein
MNCSLAIRIARSGLLLLAGAAVSAEFSFGCSVIVVPSNQELFRDARLVYEAVALNTSFQFRVERVWRGPDRKALELPWAAEQVGRCTTGQSAIAADERYLITIDCNDPVDEVAYDCPSTAVLLSAAPERMRYLRESYPLSPTEVVAEIRAWVAGEADTTDFALWVQEMVVIGDVRDWILIEDSPVSLTLGVITELDAQLNDRGVPLEEIRCEVAYIQERLAPLFIELLSSDVASSEEMGARVEAVIDEIDEIDEACWEDEPSAALLGKEA